MVSIPVSTAPEALGEPASPDRPRRISIFGATGSIGTNTLAVIADRPGEFEVEAVTAFGNAENLARVAKQVGAKVAVIADRRSYETLENALAGTGIEAAAGEKGIEEAASRPVDIVVAGIVGAAGLGPTLAAIRAGSNIALANKECLVCAGDLFVAEARAAGVRILPVDSEHNAIFQALGDNKIEDVDKIILTASGGPFRDWTKQAMAAAGPAEAIKHPNWSMGPKISVDSATLMNKGLELIEAHHLFGVGNDRLDVVVHPQSIIHGIVAFKDGTMIAAMSAPDMRMPIAHCLSWPKRGHDAGLGSRSRQGRQTDIREARPRPFSRAEDSPSGPGRRRLGNEYLNAANEIAVAAYLSGNIGFLEIARLVEDTIAEVAAAGLDHTPETIKDALALDKEGRRIATGLIARHAAKQPTR